MQEILEHIISTDEQLFIYLNNLGAQKWDSLWLWITNKESWIPFYIILLVYAFFHLKKWRKITLFSLLVGLLILVVDQSITQLFKPGFGRFRPCHYNELDGLMRLVKAYCGGKFSFVSAHSANSFALAFFLSKTLNLNKWFSFILFIWAATVAYSRVYIGVHYPLDIFFGAIWGLFLAYLFQQLYFFVIKKINK